MKLIRSTLDFDLRVQVMGVLNMTPDSFSDGGQYADCEHAIERALEMEDEGADIIDIGGESTRPGSKPISDEEELQRVLPVIEGLRGRLHIPISIDTTKRVVAERAIDAGAEIINDISGLRFCAELADVAAQSGAGLILMHSRATPETMQKIAPTEDIFVDVFAQLEWSIAQAMNRGVEREKIILDPGIGFGKTARQNRELINHLDRLCERFNLPVLLGPSRKSFIKLTLDQVMTGKRLDDAHERLIGTAASVVLGIARGARIVRVHDVSEMVTLVRMTEALLS
ncbi:MAG TPA: dihydropteroate synthase [Blastocatellia bacterium]|nr:dihydropteroate synthase [Blastocatellia bacterium]